METFICLGCDRKSVLKLNVLLAVILCTDTDKLSVLNYVKGNQPLLPLFDLHHALNGIVQHVSKKCTDIHILHKIQELAFTYEFQLNAMPLAMHALACKNGIQNLIACLVLCLINLDLALHLRQIFPGFLRIRAAFQQIDLVLQIVIFLIYNVNALLGKLIIAVLHVHNIPKGILLES